MLAKEHLSTFEVAIEKGDFELVSSLARQDLAVEDFIDGFLKFWRILGCPFVGRKLFFLSIFWANNYDTAITAKKVGKDFYRYLNQLQMFAKPPAGLTLQDLISGFMMLWRRLGYPNAMKVYWMVVYQARNFDRPETAQILGIDVSTLDKRIARLKEKGKIDTSSDE